MKRAGGNASYGVMPPPDVSLFVVSPAATPSTLVTRSGSIPAPAIEWAVRTITVATGAEIATGATAGTTRNANTALAATTYKIQVAWYGAAMLRLSEWQTLATVTTP